MRISYWSSDVCSSDLPGIAIQLACASCLNCHCRACPTAVRFKFGERRARPGDTRRGEIVLRWRQHASASVRANRRLKRYHPHPSPPPSKGEGKILKAHENPLPPCGGGLGWGPIRRDG